MQTTFALAALAAVAYGAPQGVTTDIAPTEAAPAGCSPDYSGQFEITIVNGTTTKRDLSKRQSSTCGTPGYLTISLASGQLTDSEGRTGYIAANYQFQFDKPAQTGAIYTGGFSVCSNGSLALGGSAVFYECLSGSFYNLYDQSTGAQCSPILIDIIPCSGSSSVAATQASDGQPQATTVLPPVSQITDGQPQAQSAVPVSEYTDGQPQVVTGYPSPVTQISDGQVQAPTGTPVSQISDGQIQAPTAAPVTQISDGQVQAPTATVAPVTQISDGQVQAPTGAPVTQISDGQVQAPTSVPVPAPVTQISDGQVQAPTATVAPVTQISDGQIQAPTGAPVTQISDGQIQAPPATATPTPVAQISDGQVQASGAANATTSPAAFTGAGNSQSVAGSFAAVVLGAVGMLLL